MSERPLTSGIRADGAMPDLREYAGAGGYAGLRAALKMTPTEVQGMVKAANLRGRGGA
ncbi:MAG TPA: NADH-quinone oxidoreductase subunit F, partial [Armatimonadota bacterium]|nr:NADH-quinone oxidoreductase subunit F [Armatimonadota bacterium]